MLACVCRPVSSALPKAPLNSNTSAGSAPFKRLGGGYGHGHGAGGGHHGAVVTCEPRIATATIVMQKVPGRPSGAELRAMALRQQQQIESQQQLLAAKEQRLRFLKAQEVRGAAAAAEGERLRRLRERVEAQESKLRRLRALRGQVDLQKTYNVTLSNDLDSIRALFSEKEKELSLAVAKVEALTRQLEDVRRDRRAPLALIPGSGGVGSSGGNAANATTSPAALELDKLRRELMYRNQLSLQQDARLHLQREALQQRQAELRSVDQRILELQNRLHKKKTAAGVPVNLHPQYQSAQGQLQQLQQQQQQQQQQLQQYHQQQQQQHQLMAAQQQQQAIQLLRPSNSVYPSQRVIPRGNVAAVEPYMHTPQKQPLKPNNQQQHHQLQQQQQLHHLQQQQQQQQQQHHPQLHQQSNLKKPTSQHQLIHDLTNLKLNLQPSQHHQLQQVQHVVVAESDESKLAARHQKHHPSHPQASPQYPQHFRQGSKDSADSADAKFAGHQPAALPYAKFGLSKSASSGAIPSGYQPQQQQHQQLEASSVSPSAGSARSNESDSEKFNSNATADSDSSGHTRVSKSRPHNNTGNNNSKHTNTTVHSTPLNGANKSLAIAATTSATTPATQVPNPASASQSIAPSATTTPKPIIRPKGQPIGTHKLHPGNLAVPPRKPISSVAPTTIITPPKIIAHSPKVHMVAPTNLLATPIMTTSSSTADTTYQRPALPPKPPGKQSPTSSADSADSGASSAPTVVSVISKPPMSEPIDSHSPSASSASSASILPDNLPIIKARPLTIKKQPLSEQPPKLRTGGVGGNSAQTAASAAATNGGMGMSTAMGGQKPPPMQYSRRIEMPPASLFPEIEKASLKGAAPSAATIGGAESGGESSSTTTGVDDTDRSSVATSNDDDGPQMHHQHQSVSAAHEVVRRTRSNLAISGGGGKVKLARRVSFDPLALLLDASLEGELELVRKTTMQVTNPSAANDEGITALHNAICAGHFAIVKFLVEYGCDVNAQDSDGWTPLHCAASCNNLEMVKFLVESGACLFAATLSDHETPAEKCEEDEEGFDGCSEYLYSIQEKLGILNTGEVYAVFSYDSQQPDELCFGVNDRLVILRKGDDAEREWWWARLENSGHEGYVPRNLLGLYPRILLQHSLD